MSIRNVRQTAFNFPTVFENAPTLAFLPKRGYSKKVRAEWGSRVGVEDEMRWWERRGRGERKIHLSLWFKKVSWTYTTNLP